MCLEGKSYYKLYINSIKLYINSMQGLNSQCWYAVKLGTPYKNVTGGVALNEADSLSKGPLHFLLQGVHVWAPLHPSFILAQVCLLLQQGKKEFHRAALYHRYLVVYRDNCTCNSHFKPVDGSIEAQPNGKGF